MKQNGGWALTELRVEGYWPRAAGRGKDIIGTVAPEPWVQP